MQFPLPVDVSVRVIIPEALSPAEGMYVVLRLVSLLNVQVPDVVQCPPDEIVTLPFKPTDALFAQTV